MQSYTLFLNLYEFIDKIPKKRGAKIIKKGAKIAENRSKCVSYFVDGFFGARGVVRGRKTGRKFEKT